MPDQTAPRTRIFGVLNVTPDSFSDGGTYLEQEAALTHARALTAQGADVIDVGGESTRPGAARVPASEEQRRILPVIEALAADQITVSVDTVHAQTARLAVRAGASIINDVSGGTADPEMRRVVADTNAQFVIMHWRGIPDPQHARSHYGNVVEDVRAELAALAAAAVTAGISSQKIILDPGLGFDKTTTQGWQLLAHLDRFAALGYPLLVGASRKRMLADTLRTAHTATGVSMRERDLATATVSALAARAGAWGVRVHDVSATVTALSIEAAWRAQERPTPLATCAVHGVQPEPVSAPAAAARTDRITLTGLEVFAHHGVYDVERAAGQRFIIDAELLVDLHDAAVTDQLAHTVDYGALALALVDAAASAPVDLIETLAERLAQLALGYAGVTEARITVHKPEAPIDTKFADVSVTVVRSAVQPALCAGELLP